MEYKGVILTNHLLARMKERGIDYKDLYWVFSRPDEVTEGKAKGSKKFYRAYKGQKWSVVAKKNEKGQWVLLTCWIKDLDKNIEFRTQNLSRKKESILKSMWRMIRGK